MLKTRLGDFMDLDSFIGYCKLTNKDIKKELKLIDKKNKHTKKIKYKFFDRK